MKVTFSIRIPFRYFFRADVMTRFSAEEEASTNSQVNEKRRATREGHVLLYAELN